MRAFLSETQEALLTDRVSDADICTRRGDAKR